LKVFAEQGLEFHQALDRESVEPVANEVRYVRLAEPEKLRPLRLGPRTIELSRLKFKDSN